MRSTWLILVIVVCGCGSDPEEVARQALISDGYEDVSLTQSGDIYSFHASRAGQSCMGSVAVTEELFGATVSAVTGDCVAPSDADRCRAGAAAACVPAGVAAAENNPTEAAALWEQGCELGDAEACHNAGAAQDGLQGIAPDPVRALRFCEQACEQGRAVDCHNAAIFHTRGRAGPANAVRGMELYERACAGSHQPACVNLATSLVDDDGPRAVRLLVAACDADEMIGCKNLGALYVNGDAGLERDQVRGVELVGRACSGGEDSACRVLGTIAGHSNTRPDTRAAATALLRAACASNRAAACSAVPPG